MQEERERRQRMMQEALDEAPSEELATRLSDILERDREAAQEFDQLQRLEGMLRRAPQQRAPARLAAAIMARLARQVQAETSMAELPPETQRLMMLSLSASMMAMMPMMEGASWLVLHAQRDPALLRIVMLETIGLMSLVTDAMLQLLDDAESLARTEPQVAAATLALTPYLLSSMLDYMDQLNLKS